MVNNLRLKLFTKNRFANKHNNEKGCTNSDREVNLE